MGLKTLVLLFSLAIFVNAEILKYDFVLKESADDKSVNAADDDWWRTAIIYQIYPRSFKDSNGDGTGDLQGIISKLDHLTDMGVDAVWLSPIYKSPGVDQGYDISDYRDIDPIFGTLEDLRSLVTKAHALKIKIFMDFVPSYTSDQHDWFQQSIKKNGTYTDFYLWAGDDINQPPNNWISAFGGSAWTWNDERKQYYYHAFTPEQPDLNYNNLDVVQAMKANMQFWLDFGIDGFRVDAVPQLFEDPELQDEPLSGAAGLGPSDYGYLKHIYTTHLDSTYDMVYQFRAVLDEYNKNVDYSRIMMTEAYSDISEEVARYYGNNTNAGAQFSFNFNFITDLGMGFTVDDIIRTTNRWLSTLDKKYVSNWVLGNHDQNRIASRLGTDNIDAFNMLAAFLPGVQVTYMGEEIGMENGEVTCEQGRDPRAIKNCTTFDQTSRDFERTPYQWDYSDNAGFSTASSTWLPVSSKYHTTNLQAQNTVGIKSHFNLYKDMVQFRKHFTGITYDALSLIKVADNILQIVRKTSKGEYFYLFNAGNDTVDVNIYGNEVTYLVSVTSDNSHHSVGKTLTNPVTLLHHESLIVTGVV